MPKPGHGDSPMARLQSPLKPLISHYSVLRTGFSTFQFYLLYLHFLFCPFSADANSHVSEIWMNFLDAEILHVMARGFGPCGSSDSVPLRSPDSRRKGHEQCLSLDSRLSHDWPLIQPSPNEGQRCHPKYPQTGLVLFGDSFYRHTPAVGDPGNNFFQP
jgi:hypothetical protein